jgi:hypothetical protein
MENAIDGMAIHPTLPRPLLLTSNQTLQCLAIDLVAVEAPRNIQCVQQVRWLQRLQETLARQHV